MRMSHESNYDSHEISGHVCYVISSVNLQIKYLCRYFILGPYQLI
jgi:hypothetical protein